MVGVRLQGGRQDVEEMLSRAGLSDSVVSLNLSIVRESISKRPVQWFPGIINRINYPEVSIRRIALGGWDRNGNVTYARDEDLEALITREHVSDFLRLGLRDSFGLDALGAFDARMDVFIDNKEPIGPVREWLVNEGYFAKLSNEASQWLERFEGFRLVEHGYGLNFLGSTEYMADAFNGPLVLDDFKNRFDGFLLFPKASFCRGRQLFGEIEFEDGRVMRGGLDGAVPPH
ncbi:MAG: hypothetical protein U0176_23485 [Bacteroidia bacterium]